MVNGAGSVAEILCSLELLAVRLNNCLVQLGILPSAKQEVRTRTAIGERARMPKAANRAKDDFINGFPLSCAAFLDAIIGYTGTPGIKEVTIARALETRLVRSARTAAQLIDDLDISRITGKLLPQYLPG